MAMASRRTRRAPTSISAAWPRCTATIASDKARAYEYFRRLTTMHGDD